ncbi:MAG TPA: alpha/beta hydrolase [Candidatus Sulfotelmatobacter sp.]|nr:alpha/beta hydrolase [Candidatus Sulfotelmatobacter sp.]
MWHAFPVPPDQPFTLKAESVLKTDDGVDIYVHRWRAAVAPKAPSPKAIVQIIHGLAEHAGRYAPLAASLNAEGYTVYASDLRGHGRTAQKAADLGFFAATDGWRKCLNDLWQVNRLAARENPGLPIILLGHSMGSTFARQFMAEHGDSLSAVILSGSSGQPNALAQSGRLTARLERMRLGQRGHSKLIQSLTFDAFNKRFQPSRTPFDWLSRDPAEVDKYVADPLCGFPSSTQLWVDMLDAWSALSRSCDAVPKSLPIYVISGTHDPVSAGTRALTPMLAQFRSAGLNVEHKFYPEARHELLNETNRDEVTEDLIRWLRTVLEKSADTA